MNCQDVFVLFVLVYMNTVNPVYLQMFVDLPIFADHTKMVN